MVFRGRGIDISEEMLSIARRKAATKGVSGRVSFELGDVEDIPYAGGVFDAALVAFGVRNFQDLDRGLAELYRVLQKGGQLIILELTLPAGRFARLGYGLHSRLVLPVVGRMLSRVRGAYSYLPDSIRAFPQSEAFLARLHEAGFRALRVCTLTLGVASLYMGQKPR